MYRNLLLTYLIENKDSLFIEKNATSIRETIRGITNGISTNNSITEAFVGYFRSEFEPRIDELEFSFFDLSTQKRADHLKGVFSSSKTSEALCSFLSQATYREVQSLIEDIYTFFRGTNSTIQITTPKQIDTKTKKTIRSNYEQGIIFRVDKSLVGGMTLYRDGKITDKSFASLLSRITQLTQ